MSEGSLNAENPKAVRRTERSGAPAASPLPNILPFTPSSFFAACFNHFNEFPSNKSSLVLKEKKKEIVLKMYKKKNDVNKTVGFHVKDHWYVSIVLQLLAA